MSQLSNLIVAATFGAAAFALFNGAASAAIVCSGDDCWHVKEGYKYPADAHIVVHPDDWKWKSDERYRWREHEGRGYWMHNEWRDF